MRLPEVYQVDKQAAELCTQMQVNGFGFDQQRAADLTDYLRGIEAQANAEASEILGHEIGITKTKALHHAFFKELHAPVYFRSEKTKRPSLGVAAMRGYAACADERLSSLALVVLKHRRASKLRSTYLGKSSRLASEANDLRLHPTWKNTGAVSGRWSCADPNLMNLPSEKSDVTLELGGIRSVFVPRPGCRLVSFDLKQLEMRIAAYFTGDERMIAACESTDMHAANAAIMFPGFTELVPSDVQYKKLRTIAKSAAFALCYMAGAVTVYDRIVDSGVEGVTLPRIEGMLLKLRRGYSQYYAFQAEILKRAAATAYVETPILGRRRWLSHEPKPTDCANFPIQGGAADVMNLKLPELARRIRNLSTNILPVAQVHDSGVFDCPEKYVDRVSELCYEVFNEPLTLGGRACRFPIDLKVGERWS